MLFFQAVAQAGVWNIEVVDRSGAGQFSSMKIDREGNAHIAYVATEGGKFSLKYAFWDHLVKRWFVMTVADRASFCSLTLDSKQKPHISYADRGTLMGDKLRYVYWDDTAKTWKQQAVPLNADTIAYYTSIVLDSQDRPRISFYEYDGPRNSGFRVRMRAVAWDGENWKVQTVDGQNQSGKFNSLAIDAKDRLHLAYANVNTLTAAIRYGFWDGQAWKVEMIEEFNRNTKAYIGYSAGIALDQGGDPHVTYSQYSRPYYLKYAYRKAGQWRVEAVDELAGVAYPDRNSIVIDSQGQPYISYYDPGNGNLKVAHRRGNRWYAEVVDGSRSGYTSSIQVVGNELWVSYSDEGSGGLKVARRELDPDEMTRAMSAGQSHQ